VLNISPYSSSSGSSSNNNSENDGKGVGKEVDQCLEKEVHKVDLSVLQALGIPTDSIRTHNSVITDNNITKWEYGGITYKLIGDITTITLEDIKSFIEDNLKEGWLYAVMPIVVDISLSINSEVISLSQQILVTRNVRPMLLKNWIERSLNDARFRYGIEGIEGKLIFKYRTIKYDLKKEVENKD
jgi:hypothetical protein